MNRICACVADCGDRKLLIPFFTAGFPSLQATAGLVYAAEDAGADIIELGMPFSDPMADGPEIQYSSHIALERRTTLRRILGLVAEIRRRSQIPLVLMGYFNPVYFYGVARFLADAAGRGVDGYIIPDLPLDEASDFRRLADKSGLSSIFLVAPTSTPERIRRIDAASSDFVYAVTVTGVTGTGRTFDKSTDRYLADLKKNLEHPFVAGFGVSSPDSARRLVRYADGVVIGSALVRLLRKCNNARKGASEIRSFLTRIRKAID